MVPDDNDDLESDSDEDEAEDAQPQLQGVSLPLLLGSLQGGRMLLLTHACLGRPSVIGALLTVSLQQSLVPHGSWSNIVNSGIDNVLQDVVLMPFPLLLRLTAWNLLQF